MDATMDALASLAQDRKGKARTDKRLPAKPPKDGAGTSETVGKKPSPKEKDSEDEDYKPYMKSPDFSDV